MNVAAAGWVSGELIISVCHLWWERSCDTGNSNTESLSWCGHPKCMCLRVYLWKFTMCFAYNREKESQTAWRSCRSVILVDTFACVDSTSCPGLLLCKSGNKHLSAVTVETLMVWGISISAKAKEARDRGREMASGEIEQNERGQEERWKDDQRKHVGHFTAVQKGLIYPIPSFPTWPEGKQQLWSKTASPLSGQELKWLGELLMETEVRYCWLKLCAVTHHSGPGLSWLQRLATALINTLLFTH